ncbi:MAG TPA: MBL fold metallo-hydrolase [Bryobacteraceae bacterium]|nr:MBL fold metallo-hydrolase [Bryobacteraceae bacterium]
MIHCAQKDDVLLADVCGPHLWWLGQSGFLLHYRGRYALIDPYLSDSLTNKYAGTDKPHVRITERVIDPNRLDFVDVVTSSHAHTDHLDPETLQPVFAVNRKLKIVAPAASREVVRERTGAEPIGLEDGSSVEVSGFVFHGIAAAHEDLSPAYLGYLIECGPYRIYHSGDCVPYDGLVERLRPFKVDVALLPINGRAPERRVAGNFTGREAARLARDVGARVAIPMHYEMFEFNTASPDEFVAEAARVGLRVHIMRCGERFTYCRNTG